MFFSNLFAIQINVAFEFFDARMQEWVGLYVFIYDFASGVEMSWMCKEQPFEAYTSVFGSASTPLKSVNFKSENL